MTTNACLKTVNWCGKANTHPALRKRRIIGADGLLFLLLWSSGHIQSKIGLPLSVTSSFLVFRCMIAVLFAGIYTSLRSGRHWHDQRSSLIGFLGHCLWLIVVPKAFKFGISAGSAALITAMQPVLAALLVMIAILLEDFGLFGRFQPFHFLLILAVFLRGKHVYKPVK